MKKFISPRSNGTKKFIISPRYRSRRAQRRIDEAHEESLADQDDDAGRYTQVKSEREEESNASYMHYDEEEEEEERDEEANSLASSDIDYERKNAHRPSFRNEESLADEDDIIDEDEDDDDDVQSADSYTVGNYTVEDCTIDGNGSVSSRDRRALKLCHRLASKDHILTEIDVDCSTLTREIAKMMAELLQQNDLIERIRLTARPSNKTSMANFRYLVRGIAKNASVTDLQIRNTLLTREAAGHLSRALSTNTSLQKLCLHSCQFDDSALPVLFLGMQHNNCIHELYILQCDLSEPFNADVVSASVPLLELKSLCLIDTRLTLAGLRFLVQNIERTPSLTQLNLSMNRKVGTPSAIRLIGDVLKSTKMINLTSVSLSSCALDSYCVGELAKCLEGNAKLTSLYLSDNRCGDDGARYLRKLLERNRNIKELIVKGCDITKRRQRAIDDGLKYNNSLLKSFLSKKTSLSIFDAVELMEEFGNSVTGAAKAAKEGVNLLL